MLTDEEDSDIDHWDEFEESFWDIAEPERRQSVAEMVTMHKLNTTKTILNNDTVSFWFKSLLTLSLADPE